MARKAFPWQGLATLVTALAALLTALAPILKVLSRHVD